MRISCQRIIIRIEQIIAFVFVFDLDFRIKTALEEAASMPEGIAAGIAVQIKKEVDDTRG